MGTPPKLGRYKCGVKVRIFNRLLIFLDVRATSQPLAVAVAG